jgi:hypothetical protein
MGQSKGHNINSGNIRVASEVQKGDNISTDVFHITSILGNSSMVYGGRHKQQKDGKLDILGTVNNIFGTNVKRVTKMGEAKLVLWILDIIGVPIYSLAFILNIGTWRGWIMFVIGAMYGVARLFFYVWKNYQDAKLRDLEIKDKEFDFTEKVTREDEE